MSQNGSSAYSYTLFPTMTSHIYNSTANDSFLPILSTTASPLDAPLSGNSEPSDVVLYVVFVLNGVLALTGLVGNLLVCMIIIGGRKMYTIANLFLMNLAIADICVLVISYTLWVVQNILQNKWPFGSALCKIIPAVSDAFYGVSLGCMTTISIHRYRMILHAMDTQMSFLQAKVIIIFIWIISIGTISVPLYPAKVYLEQNTVSIDNNTETFRSCFSQWPSRSYERTYQLFLFIAWYVLPLVVILWTFLRIRVYLKKQMAYEWLSGREHSALISHHVLSIKRALRMLAPVVIIFAVLMLPWNMLRLVSVVVEIWTLPNVHVYVLISGTMLVANSVVNPFIYYLMSKEFRQEFRKQFWLCRKCLGLAKNGDEFIIEKDTLGRRCIRRMDSVREVNKDLNANSSKVQYQHLTDKNGLERLKRHQSSSSSVTSASSMSSKLENGYSIDGDINATTMRPALSSIAEEQTADNGETAAENGATADDHREHIAGDVAETSM